jgi:hypothetical protein
MQPAEQRRNPEYRRQAIAKRRLGKRAKCVHCGEDRSAALIRKSKPRICAECQRTGQGKTKFDLHHVAGKNNHAGTIPVSANDHRARLSATQLNWPLKTLQNTDGSPVLAIAACIRGVIDFFEYCIDVFLRWIAEVLERLDTYLVDKNGPGWWVGTSFEVNYLKTKKEN